MSNKHLAEIKFVSDNSELRKKLHKEFGEDVYSTDVKAQKSIQDYLLNYFLVNEDDEEPTEIVESNLNKKQKKIYKYDYRRFSECKSDEDGSIGRMIHGLMIVLRHMLFALCMYFVICESIYLSRL